jgi:hypothetical protein
MQSSDYILLITRWLHIGAAIVAIGGAFFMRVALMPAANSTLDDATHAKLREALRKRWFIVVQTCIAILLVTGGINFVMLALPPKIEPMPYHAIFGVKFLAALGVFFIASVLVGRGEGMAKMRANRARWLTVLLVLAAVIVILSGVLNRLRWNAPSRSRASAAPPCSVLIEQFA